MLEKLIMSAHLIFNNFTYKYYNIYSMIFFVYCIKGEDAKKALQNGAAIVGGKELIPQVHMIFFYSIESSIY